MRTSRRGLLMAAAALGAAAPMAKAAGVVKPPFKAPPGFLWGTAISGHQSEGNNTNSDSWIRENVTPTLFKDRSGDACDSYHRFGEDMAIAADLGFDAYRMGIEWSRIEPTEGCFSNAELDHYAVMLETCRAKGLKPIVSFNHFTTPIWFAGRGGFEREDSPDLFARYCGKAAGHLGGLMHMATPFNEANIAQLVSLFPQNGASRVAAQAMIDAAARATGSPRFSSLAFADPAVTTPLLLEAHRKGHDAIKAARRDLPVGLSLTTQAIQPVGENSLADQYRDRLYGDWIEAGRTHADFIGLQPYTRFLVDDKGIAAPPKGAQTTDSGYEFYPQAVGDIVRWAHATFDKPLYVTENGIATDDDARRIAFIDQALESLAGCLAEGIEVYGYLYWSLLDNFEWTSGYAKHFGLVAVDRESFKRIIKPSALHLGDIARASR